jgi:pimeloyl-ACP methyl ester carboxylesterase
MTHRRLRSRYAFVLAASMLALGVVGAPAAATETSGGASTRPVKVGNQVQAPVPEIDWLPCGPGLDPFLCATAEVPSDYDRPHGRPTTIALTKLPASGDPAERMGTIFINPGGPGNSGVDYVQQAGLLFYDPEVLHHYDLLGFDPRGVARSDPATCFRTAAEESATTLFDMTYPLSTREEIQFIGEAFEAAVRCQTTSPARFATSSTANVARDMDLLRQAVGDERLNYIGYSYGTYLGASYARLFPDRVGRFVLDGTVDPVAWSGTGTGDSAPSVPLGIRIGQGAGGQETFAEFARLCAAAGPAGCPLAALGDPTTVVHELFERLAVAPVEVPMPDGTSVLVTQQVAVSLTFDALFSPAGWPELAALLAALAASAPDPAEVVRAATGTRSALGARLRGEDYPSIGGGLASMCVDIATTGRVDRYPRLIDAADAAAPYFGRLAGWLPAPLVCEFWRLNDEDSYTGPWQQTTTAPVLVVGTRFDPATPYRQAAPYAARFPAGHLLTLNGWGHTSLGKSQCINAHIARYLITSAVPADGSVCAPDTVPFTTADARVLPQPDVPPGLPLG